jgi:hypothetical protein
MHAFGQDSVAIRQFIDANKPFSQQFTDALKRKDINQCLTFFTDKAVKTFGKDFLLSELKELSVCYEKYSDPEVEYSIGVPMGTVGTFGHDVDGTMELECSYRFNNKKKQVNYFMIYYTNTSPKGLIQTFATKASIDKELEEFKQSK